MAAGHIRAATAAADPLLEPPGVCAELHGFRVGPGSRLANIVVTVFPRTIAPAKEFGAHRRAKALGVEDVLDSDGNAVKNAAELLAVRLSLALPRIRQHSVAVESHPCPNLRLDLIYARKQSLHMIDGR